MTKPLSIGVIGCGGIAQMMHLPTLAERPDLFRIAHLADISPTTLEVVAKRYNVPAAATDWRAVIANRDIEAVLIASSGSHKDVVVAALEADKHVFCEKPLGYGFLELEAVMRAANKSKGRLMVGYHKRFDPSYQRAREAVRAIEDLRFVQVTVLHPDDDAYRSHHAILPWKPFLERAESVLNQATITHLSAEPNASLFDEISGKGTAIDQRIAASMLYDSLIHDLNALRGVLGEPQEVLSAHIWNGGFAQTSVTKFPKDVHANISWISVPGLKHYEETVLFVAPKQRVKLIFPSPYLRHHPTPLIIERMDGSDLVEEHRVCSYEEAFRAEMHYFREAILSGAHPAPSIEDAWRDTQWIQAIAAAYRGAPARVRHETA
jgi:predicted dehydrogenase